MFYSTHSITGAEVKFHIMKHYAYQRVIRDYNNSNYVGLNNDLTGTNWEEEVCYTEIINEMNSNFNQIIASYIKNISLIQFLQSVIKTKYLRTILLENS